MSSIMRCRSGVMVCSFRGSLETGLLKHSLQKVKAQILPRAEPETSAWQSFDGAVSISSEDVPTTPAVTVAAPRPDTSNLLLRSFVQSSLSGVANREYVVC